MIVNPGNILPFYNNIYEQWRYRYNHGWGIPASVETLIPFQLYEDRGTPTTENFFLVNYTSGQMIPIPLSLIEEHCINGRKYYTWTGLRTISGLECGLWYILYQNNFDTYYSELLDLQNIGNFEQAGLAIGSCAAGTFELVAFDSIVSSLIDQTIEQQQSDGSWNVISTGNTATYNALFSPGVTSATVHFRRTIQLTSGSCLTSYYSLYIPDVTDPCTGYTFVQTSVNSYLGNPYRHMIQFWNDTDTNDILYSQNYKQKVYIDAYRDFPENIIERETVIDGNGFEQILSSNVKERRNYDFPYLPDFWIDPFTNIATHTDKRITSFKQNETFEMEEYNFSYREMEEGYFSRGRFNFRAKQWFSTGCEEDETIITCP